MNRTLIAIMTSLLTLAALSPDAEARSLGGIAGRHVWNADKDCFQENAGRVHQTYCSGNPRNWVVPMVIDSAGSYAPSYRVYGGAGQVTCVAVAVDGNNVVAVTPSTPNSTSGYSSIVPGSVYVPSGGYLYGICGLGPNTLLISFSW